MTGSGEKVDSCSFRIRVVISTNCTMLEFPVCACQQLATITGQVQVRLWKSPKFPFGVSASLAHFDSC